MVLQSFEQAVGGNQRHLGVAVFARIRGLGLAAELPGHRLHAVADAEQRKAAVEHLLRRGGRTLHRGRLRTAGQDDALWRERRDLVRVVVPGPDFAVDAQLADARSEEHTSELKSLMRSSYAVFCLKKQ